MEKIKLLVDSACDLTPDVAEENDIRIIPFKLTLDGENYIDDKFDITPEEFYKTLRETDATPKTAQITPLIFEEVFREELENADEIIFIGLSAKTSGTFNNAVLVKNMLEEETGKKIHLVDAGTFSLGYGDAALRAAKMIKEGKTAEDIVEALEEILANTEIYFGVETLDYLKKGGRITTMSAIIGGMLDIRPILKVQDGLVGAIDKVKGEKKMFLKIEEYIKKETEGLSDFRLILLASDDFSKTEKLREIAERNNLEVAGEGIVGSTIGCHAGPGAFGVVIVKK